MNPTLTTNPESAFSKLVELLEKMGDPLFIIGKTPITFASILTCIGLIIISIIISIFLRKILTKRSTNKEILK